RADRFALADIGATAEEFLLDLGDHVQRSQGPFRLALREKSEVTNFGSCEKGGRGIGTCGHAGAATDAGGSIHGEVGVLFRNRDSVAIGRTARGYGNESSAGNNSIEGTSIDDQIFDHGEGPGAPRLQVEHIAIFEMTHVKLA